MENKMRVVSGIVAAAFLVPLAANAETIDGLFGIKFGSRPDVLREFQKIKSLDARLVLVASEDENAPDCLALLDKEGKVVQVKFMMPGPVEKSRQAVMKEWKPKYGEPTISGVFEFSDKQKASFDTFVVGGTALCCEVDGKIVTVESTDIVAMTNLLVKARRPKERSERERLAFWGRKIGYNPPPHNPAKPYEIGSGDRVWRFSYKGKKVVVVHDGQDFWLRLGGRWEYRPESTIGGRFTDYTTFQAKLNETAQNGIEVWHSASIEGAKTPIETEPMPAAFADTPPDASLFGAWEKANGGRETIQINQDGSIKWEGGLDERTEWRWHSRCGCLLALPEDFDSDHESYHDTRAVLLQMPEGGLHVLRRGVFRKRKSGVEHTAKAIAKRLDKDVGNE